ncbi:MAG: Wzt carbohydrate-binding domain-containing protein, partial [Cytophagales bacterium]|nr:Wzt carbohydrate-binding domain-containing protein [Armatimonadota bacterium]
PRTQFSAGEPVRVEIAYQFGRPLPCPIFGFDLFRVSDNQHIYTTSNYDNQLSLAALPPSGTITLDIGALNLNAGRYRVQVNLFAEPTGDRWWEHPEDELSEAVILDVSCENPAQGWIHLPLRWEVPLVPSIAGTRGV